MTKIKITANLIYFKSFDPKTLQALIPEYTILEFSMTNEFIEVTIAQDVDQIVVDTVVSGLRDYVLANLLKGEIITK